MATVFDSLRLTRTIVAKDEGSQLIVFTTVPEVEKLCCIIATYDESDKPNLSMYSYYSWTILKCRTLIFTLADLIATPEIGELRQICIIVSKEFFSLNKLQPELEKLGLKFKRPKPVLKNTYEACLRYTITARLAPTWNLVGNYLVQGRNFITSNIPINSVRTEIVIIGEQLQLLIWPSRVALSPAIFNTFHLSESKDDPGNHVLDIENYNIQVHVLPSMKSATATFLQTKLPESSPFRTYKAIKRYWKNIYGYRLPENDSPENKMMYVTVKFNKQHPGLTYPIMCLKSNPIINVRPKNETEILMYFLTDLTQKIPNICGEPFSSKACVGVAVQKLNHPSTMRFMKIRQPDSIENMMIVMKCVCYINQFSENPNITSRVPLEEFITPLHPTFLSDQNNNNRSLTTSGVINSKLKIGEEDVKKKAISMISWPSALVTSANSSVTTITLTSTADTPIGGTVKPYNCHFNKNCATATSSLMTEVIPSQSLSTSVSTHKTQPLPEQLNIFYSDLDKKKNEEQFRKPTVFRTYSSEMNSVGIFSRPKYAPVFYPRSRSTVKPVTSTLTSPYFNSHQTSRASESITVSHYSQQPMKPSAFINNNAFHHSSPVKETSITMSSLLKREGCSMKTYESGVKKRSRPQVQADIDVRAMACSTEGLARVNTTTLIAYLRAQGIPCKVKDKKGDLVAKVMAHLKNEN